MLNYLFKTVALIATIIYIVLTAIKGDDMDKEDTTTLEDKASTLVITVSLFIAAIMFCGG